MEYTAPFARPSVTKGTSTARRRRSSKGMERWRVWQKALDDGVYPTRAALARAEGVSRAAVTQGLAKLGDG